MKRLLSLIACIAVVAAVTVAVPQVVATGATAPSSGPSAAVATETGGPQTSGSENSAVQATASGGSDSPNFEDGVVLVELRNGATAADLNALLPQLGYIATKQVAEDDIALGYAELALSDDISVSDAQARITHDAASIVAAAQPNFIYHLADNSLDAAATVATPSQALVPGIVAQATEINDSYQNQQWALNAVNAYDAWDIQKTEGAVTVAVIDNGFLTSHEDLKANIATTYNALNGGTDVSPINGASDRNHGTHVAGIVAATANNGLGVAGVSYNARLLPIQAFQLYSNQERSSASSASIRNAYAYIMRFANTYNIKVVNMSLGVRYSELSDDDKALISAVKSAHGKGILTVAAAGNEVGSDNAAYTNYPSDWIGDCALTVIATTNQGVRASYSNYNMSDQECKQISAPGSSIYSTYATSDSSYSNDSGTSMAAPCVAGIAALVFAADPELTADEARDILCKTADSSIGDAGWDKETGYGLVDAKAAVSKAKEGASNGSGDGDGGNGDGSGDNEGNETGDGGSEGDDNSGSDGDGGAGEGDGEPEDKGGSEGDGDPESKNDAEEEVVNDSATLTDKPADQKRSDINPITETVVTAPAGTKITKLKAGKRSFTVKWKKQATQTSGYQVQYSLKKSFKSKTKTVTVSKVKTTSKKIKKLKAKKRYYVRVRTFKVVGGERYYSTWSARKSVKTRA